MLFPTYSTTSTASDVLDPGVFDDVFPDCLVLLLFAGGLGQGHGQNVFDTAGVVDVHTLNLIGGQILLDVLAIFRRQDYILHAGTLGGEEFLLNASHRE